MWRGGREPPRIGQHSSRQHFSDCFRRRKKNEMLRRSRGGDRPAARAWGGRSGGPKTFGRVRRSGRRARLAARWLRRSRARVGRAEHPRVAVGTVWRRMVARRGAAGQLLGHSNTHGPRTAPRYLGDSGSAVFEAEARVRGTNDRKGSSRLGLGGGRGAGTIEETGRPHRLDLSEWGTKQGAVCGGWPRR